MFTNQLKKLTCLPIFHNGLRNVIIVKTKQSKSTKEKSTTLSKHLKFADQGFPLQKEEN